MLERYVYLLQAGMELRAADHHRKTNDHEIMLQLLSQFEMESGTVKNGTAYMKKIYVLGALEVSAQTVI